MSWIVSNANGDRFRTWDGGIPAWTWDRELATRYSRRADAEKAHEGDEDAWRITEFADAPDAAMLVVADALECFWNASIGSARNSQNATALAIAGALSEGFAAIATRLRAGADTGITIDLDKADWVAILKAASESAWIPPEYTRNDWAADICSFLRCGGALPERHVTHCKRGSTYGVLGEAEAQISTNALGYQIDLGRVRCRILTEGDKLVVYRDPKTGKLWCRFPDEFADGRFEEVGHG